MNFPTEFIIVKNHHVKAALMFGRGRLSNGVLIEPASYDEAENLGVEKFRNLIWLVVDVYKHLWPLLTIVPGQALKQLMTTAQLIREYLKRYLPLS